MTSAQDHSWVLVRTHERYTIHRCRTCDRTAKTMRSQQMSDTPSSAPYTPDSEHVRSAWRYAMTGQPTPDAAADAAFDRYEEQQKARGISIGHIAAQEAFQSTITDALNTHAADVLRRTADALDDSDMRLLSDAVRLLRETAEQIETPPAGDDETEGAA